MTTRTPHYSPFGSCIQELQYAYSDAGDTSKYRFGFNGEEFESDISGEGMVYDLGERFYDGRLCKMLSLDPLMSKYPMWSPYSYCGNSPISIVDLDGNGIDSGSKGANSSNSQGAPTASRITGTGNVVIMIADYSNPNEKIDTDRMNEQSGWDYIYANNIEEASEILKNSNVYGTDKLQVNQLVIQSHGAPGKGPKIAKNANDDKQSNTNLGDPSKSNGMIYIKSLLSSTASILFTACSTIQGYGKNEMAKNIARVYSKFLLEGTQRKMFMNFTQTDGTRNVKGSNLVWFNFDHQLVHQHENPKIGYWAGFYLFYFNSSGIWKKMNFHYKISVTSDGKIMMSVIKQIDIKGPDEKNGIKPKD